MGIFSGDTICVSGAFSISQNEMKELVVKNGAHIATTPNKLCTYLVADSIGSSKTMKAEKDGIPIVTEEWVQKSIKAGKKSTDASLFLSGGPSIGGKSKGVAKSAGGAKKKSKKVESDEEEEEEEEEEEKPKKKASVKKAAAASIGGSVFSGEVFCVSGSFSISQAEMRKLLITNGGDVVDTPNKKCTNLVADSIGSSKTMKAQTDGIKIVTEEWVNDSIAKGKMSTNKKFFLSGGDAAGDDDMDDEEDVKPKKKSTPAKHKIKSKAVDGPKKKKIKTTPSKSILWIDPNNLANNKEHLDAVGMDRVESVGSLDEATTWLKNQQKVRPKILTQIKIVSNMARMESGIFQPQAGIITATSLAELGVPYENILVYTSKERAKGKFPSNVRLTYDDAELIKFLASAANHGAEDGDDNDGDDGDANDDNDDDGDDEECEPDPKPQLGSIRLNMPDSKLLFHSHHHGTLRGASEFGPILYTNYNPSLPGAPLAKYRSLIINNKRVYLFDARPENRASIQLIEETLAALLKARESGECPHTDGEEEPRSADDVDEYQFYYQGVESLEWVVPNESSKFQTQAEVIKALETKKYQSVVIVNHEWNHEKLKQQLTSAPLLIDSIVFKNILKFVKPDSVVHRPSFIERVNDKKYQLVWSTYECCHHNFFLLDARPSNLKAIERLRQSMGTPWESFDSGYQHGWFTQPNAPLTEPECRKIILRQRITSSETTIYFRIGQYRTRELLAALSEACEEEEGDRVEPFLILEDEQHFDSELK